MASPVEIIHATTVAVEGKAALIIGPSGSGKSSLALELMSRGAVLVADDRTRLTRHDETLVADVPEAIAGLIEARGVGLIKVPFRGPTQVHLVIDLSQTEPARLPATKQHEVLGVNLPCLHKADTSHFPSAILFYMNGNL